MGKKTQETQEVLTNKLIAGLNALASWFERQKRVLPWRSDPSLYRVWISEIMLQQTQVVTVVPYFERFIDRFPTVEALAGAPLEDVLMHWAGLGYYSRARNLHKAAVQIVERGGFPTDREGWLELPGVGNYTAGAILSIALNQPEAILDGNVERVLSRVRTVSRAQGDEVFKQRLWRLSRIFVETGVSLGIRPSVLNQAMMELGATVCSPKKPRCPLCPLNQLCRANMRSLQDQYPPRKKPKAWIKVREEVHCVIDHQGRILLTEKKPGEWRAGLWDFPQSLELKNLKSIGKVENKLVVTRHKITRITNIWRIASVQSKSVLQAAEATHLRWVSADLPEVAVGSSVRKTLRSIRDAYPEVLQAR